MRDKAPKSTVHVYFPEASCKGTKINLSEDFYLKHSFQRNAKKVLKTYGFEHQKDFLKKYKKNEHNDQFFIVCDTDISPSRNNIDIVKRDLNSYQAKYPRAKLILSARSFETWLCMYNNKIYTKPFTTQGVLTDDMQMNGYEKKEDWFKKNAKYLYDNYEDAISTSKRSKKNVFESHGLTTLNLNDHPGTLNSNIIHQLVTLTPFTYFDILIGELMN
ncbi:RloB domain-containing protein [Exiguobacterium sp. s146]|uniref:RloB domain-containing protein n=1 Tax=Exiguobacterium sp. s146 TaxID=2751223 RepID=UPI001BE6C3EA|nr:RloB domain-containing protein [Exiguobacterium sp. s146]